MAKNVKGRSRPGRSRISSKHQVTIPAVAFRRAGLAAGDVVKVEAMGSGQIVMTKVEDLIDRYAGILSAGGALRRDAEALRDEW